MTLPVWQVSPMDFGLVQQTGASDSYGLARTRRVSDLRFAS